MVRPTQAASGTERVVETVLSRTQSELVALERRLVLRVRDAIAHADGPAEDVERLAALLHEMDELFLVVVVGEYNAGKSTFVNALLGADVFETGDLPTTRAISVLRYGEPGPPERAGEHLLVYRYPVDFLRDLEIVDTPGTNSIERMEEAVTRGFVPRADLVLFVTSLLQPITASEADFLGHIREWGKKVVFVVNGADRRNSDEQLERVRDYLRREVASRIDGGRPPAVYVVSALEALRAKRGGDRAAPLDARNEYPALERYLLETLRETERVRLKLLSPLGVLRNVLSRTLRSLERREEAVREDGGVLRSVRDQLAQYTAEMERDAGRHLAEVRNVLNDVERRGRHWFEDNVRIANIGLLRNKDAVENRFRTEVVADAPRQIEQVVHSVVDWLVRNNMKLWNAVVASLQEHTARLKEQGALAPEGGAEFQYNREDLFARLRAPIEQRLGQFDTDREARDIVAAVKESLARTFGVNVLALGLGAVVVAIFTTVALDVSGVISATLLALAGWLILPARRRRLVRELEAKIAQLDADLAALLSASFTEQLGRYEEHLLEVIAPYERFLAVEGERVGRALGELRAAEQEVAALEQRIDAALPEGRPTRE